MTISATRNFHYNFPCLGLSLWWKMRNGKLIPRCAARAGISEKPEDLQMTFSADNRAWEILLPYLNLLLFVPGIWKSSCAFLELQTINPDIPSLPFITLNSRPSGNQHKHTLPQIKSNQTNSAAWLHSIQSSPLPPSIRSPLTILFSMALQECVS